MVAFASHSSWATGRLLRPAMPISRKATLKLLDEAPRYPEGTGLRLMVKTAKDLAAIRKLALDQAGKLISRSPSASSRSSPPVKQNLLPRKTPLPPLPSEPSSSLPVVISASQPPARTSSRRRLNGEFHLVHRAQSNAIK